MTVPLIWGSSGEWVPADTVNYEGGGIVMWWDLYTCTIDNVRTQNIGEYLIGGSITMDLTRDIIMSATFELQNPSIVDPYVDFLAPYLNLEYADGRPTVRKQMGLYSTQVSPGEFSLTDSKGTIEGADLCSVLAEDSFTATYNIAAGTNVVEAVKAIVNSAGITRISIPASSKTLSKKRTFRLNETKLHACNSLLHSIGYYELSPTIGGYLISIGATRPIAKTKEWQTLSDEDIMAPIVVTPTNDRICNTVVVVNSDTAEVSRRARATNSDPSSPTSTVSIGRRITKYEKMEGEVTQADLQARADRLLAQGRSYYRTASVKILPDPHGFDCHQRLDLDLTGEMEFLNGRWWISSATMGFTADTALLQLGINQTTRAGLAVDI